MAGKDQKATQAAEEKAKELEVNLGQVKGSGKDGSVTVADVEEKAAEPERLLWVKLADPLTRSVKAADGVRYFGGEEVTESHFDAVLANEKDLDGNRALKKGGSV